MVDTTGHVPGPPLAAEGPAGPLPQPGPKPTTGPQPAPAPGPEYASGPGAGRRAGAGAPGDHEKRIDD
jgi:hypothetical protein